MSTTSNTPNSEVSLTYKFLLAFSTLSAIFFCWLYVTKPTTVVAEPNSPVLPESESPSLDEKASSEPSSFAALTQTSLPGDDSPRPTQVDASNNGVAIPLAQSISTASEIGWEETNDRIQHVLEAQDANASERLILQVPVIYQTRGLRFGPTEAKEAARILRALKIYRGQIAKLHKDGKNIQQAWDSLLLAAQPIRSLRADSPSLPASQYPDSLSENSSATINISE